MAAQAARATLVEPARALIVRADRDPASLERAADFAALAPPATCYAMRARSEWSCMATGVGTLHRAPGASRYFGPLGQPGPLGFGFWKALATDTAWAWVVEPLGPV